ncbi:hypothetical protein JL09_g7082 [Pichia kudriavzevii]|uniref:Uncharacterized protein n=1 Tax=Pichia kudriavzevii TaxID=4909 RepID=A0A099NK32_PICKU|nr:hypothetical protein JL09_g7083 [Pichia kudriavzevii]KGK32311.1 hypothetical protein JL09_g7082 [Pichia kudriavzevii]
MDVARIQNPLSISQRHKN